MGQNTNTMKHMLICLSNLPGCEGKLGFIQAVFFNLTSDEN